MCSHTVLLNLGGGSFAILIVGEIADSKSFFFFFFNIVIT